MCSPFPVVENRVGIPVSGKDAAEKASSRVREDLAKTDLVGHTAKCSWVLSQEICHGLVFT